MWCISSAILMTLILWATTPAALQALHTDDEEDDDGLEASPGD